MNSSKWVTYVIPLFFGSLISGIAVALQPFGLSNLLSAASGPVAIGLASLLARRLRRTHLRPLIGGLLGLFAGALLGLAILFVSNAASLDPTPANTFLRLGVPIVLAYVGIAVGIAKSAEMTGAHPSSLSGAVPARAVPFGKVLDTSVLIDGRISEIVESGFMDGPLYIPQFVLRELQAIAGSADSSRRARGRRGLDVVQQMQKIPDLKIEVSSQDFPLTHEVDLKLIEFAKLHAVKIVTNDFNLNKLAQLQGIHVLNINQLANSLKPIVLPGELMHVFILKEGKEQNQGIAYLDDGTMVVVDHARRMMSKNIDIVVTSVLQTTAGKMIFGRYDEGAQTVARSAPG